MSDILIGLLIGCALGFAIGYGVRDYVSRKRRREAAVRRGS
jgi:NhaP-type Na+/H+ or K+/H+ antiporter